MMTPEDYIGSYNSNDKPEIDAIKQSAKHMIKLIQDLPNEDHRRKAMACSHIEEATMIAIKSIFS